MFLATINIIPACLGGTFLGEELGKAGPLEPGKLGPSSQESCAGVKARQVRCDRDLAVGCN